MGETVTVLRPATTVDRYSNIVSDWADPTETDVDDCAVAPAGSTENNTDRRAVTSSLTLFTPATADIRPNDRVRVRGVVYEVDGQPGDWRNPFTGNEPGLEVALRRVDG